MNIQTNEAEKRRSMTAALKLNPKSLLQRKKLPTSGENVINEIVNFLFLTEQALAAILKTTDRSLRTWKKVASKNLIDNKKSHSLIQLYYFIEFCKDYEIPPFLIDQLLHKPIQPRIPNSKTVREFIVEHDDESTFDQFSILIIERFITELNWASENQIKLNTTDFESFENNIKNPPKANPQLAKAIAKRKNR